MLKKPDRGRRAGRAGARRAHARRGLVDDAARLLGVRAGATGIDVGVWIRLGSADDVYEIAAVDTTASELTLATKFFYGTAATLIGRDLGVTVPGKLPRQYASAMVDVADEFCMIASLTPGAEYFVRVCTTRTRSAARTRPSA